MLQTEMGTLVAARDQYTLQEHDTDYKVKARWFPKDFSSTLMAHSEL